MRHSSVHLGTARLDFWVHPNLPGMEMGWISDASLSQERIYLSLKKNRGRHMGVEDKSWHLWPAAVDASRNPSVKTPECHTECRIKDYQHALFFLIMLPRFYGAEFNRHKPGGFETSAATIRVSSGTMLGWLFHLPIFLSRASGIVSRQYIRKEGYCGKHNSLGEIEICLKGFS